MTKNILLWPLWWTRFGRNSIYQGLMDYPPPGYRFVYPPDPPEQRAFGLASRARFPGLLLNALDKAFPVAVAKNYLERSRRVPPDIDLVYSMSHLVFAKRPWVVDLEHVTYLVDNRGRHFRRFKKSIEKALASPYCKMVLCYSDLARKGVLANLDCPGLDPKVDKLPNAVPAKNFTKAFNPDGVKILFVASANTPKQFYIKGGPLALAAFEALSRRFPHLEMVARSDMPPQVKARHQGLRGLRIIEKVLPWEEMEREWKSADIFLLPAHSPPFLAFLDALSYELPVVTIDAPGNSELVEDGKTGLVAPRWEEVPYFREDLKFVPDYGAPEFQEAIKRPHPAVVQGLVERLSLLIENEELRRRLGRAGRWEVEQGRFSIERRNQKLKEIFDEATA